MTEVESIGNPIASIIAAAERANPPEQGDYYDEEGFLVCGKCHTRREYIPSHQIEGMEGMKVKILCKCRQEEERRKEEEDRRRKDMEAVEALRGRSLMDSRLKDATFENIQTTDANARNLKLCKSYAERFDQMVKKNQGLLLYGGVGTGKTFAAACIANYLLERQCPVVMTSFIKLLESAKGFDEEFNKAIQRLNKVKLLIIDDLGAERDTGFAIEKVYDIIDSRYRAKLPVILTTNLSLEEMKSADDIRYARIYDRIFEQCYPMQFTGRSWRKSEANRKFKEMEMLLEGDHG